MDDQIAVGVHLHGNCHVHAVGVRLLVVQRQLQHRNVLLRQHGVAAQEEKSDGTADGQGEGQPGALLRGQRRAPVQQGQGEAVLEGDGQRVVQEAEVVAQRGLQRLELLGAALREEAVRPAVHRRQACGAQQLTHTGKGGE